MMKVIFIIIINLLQLQQKKKTINIIFSENIFITALQINTIISEQDFAKSHLHLLEAN